jgi:hypothetical protein
MAARFLWRAQMTARSELKSQVSAQSRHEVRDALPENGTATVWCE